MPAINNPYAKYKSNSINTASKEDLTLMLYEGALKFCNQAIIALENNDIMETHRLIMRVEDIIEELQGSLDYKYEISKNFYSLYEYMFKTIADANVSKNKDLLIEVRDLFREFRDMWKDAIKLAKQ